MSAATKSLITLFDRIKEASLRVGRDPGEVIIVGVTKGHPAEIVSKARALGLEHLGENRVQEAIEKYGTTEFLCSPTRPTLHLIGHLQTNKVRKAVQLFDSIDTVDSITTAAHLNQSATEMSKRLRILIQVNTSGEAQKSGCTPDQAIPLALSIKQLSNLTLRGFMTIGPLEGNEQATRATFRRLRQIRDLALLEPELKEATELSMGMSGDFEWAIEEGATEIRLGTVLWGPRVS